MQANRRNITILFFTLIVVMMGFGMAIPVLPFYVDSFGASGSKLGLLMSVYAVMQFIFAPVWGSMSDRYGRKPLILLGVLGNAITQLMFGLATSMWMLFAARALAGILSAATLPTAMAYISDSTTNENRSSGMGMIGAAMGIGMVLGPGLGGILATDSLSLPFFIAAGLSTIALGLIAALLPESLPEDRRVQTAGFKGPQIRQLWRALFSPIGLLLIVAFIISFGLTNFEAVFGLYAKDVFAYDAGQVGGILMFIGVVSAVMQAVLTGPLTTRFGEVTVLRASLVLTMVGFVIMLAAENLAGILVTTFVFVAGNSLLRPVTSSLTSKRATVPQGVAMGLNNSFMSLGRIVGPVWAGLLYDVDLHLPYLSGAAITAIGLVVCMIWLKAASPGQQPAGESVSSPSAAR
ncbi:MAG: MFS transporter [Anaerolineae bacterium]|nr:MFS transporter [Anaerolineae bacterium]